MGTTTFAYSKKNQKNIALLFLSFAIIGALLTLYMWFWADQILLFALVSGIFMAALGLAVFLKLLVAPKKENETAIIITDEGIQAATTSVAIAAGLIEWKDIKGIMVHSRTMEIDIREPDKYAKRMTNFFVRDTFIKSLKGTIRISLIQTNATYEGIWETISQHAEEKNIYLHRGVSSVSSS